MRRIVAAPLVAVSALPRAGAKFDERIENYWRMLRPLPIEIVRRLDDSTPAA